MAPAADQDDFRREDAFPRLLLIDMTPIGGPTATGGLKHAYFGDWPQDRLLHLSAPAPAVTAVSAGAGEALPLSEGADAAKILAAFAPEVILYRPIAERPLLHALAMEIARQSGAGLAIWLMDDWPARLSAEAPEEAGRLDGDLRELLGRAALRLAISPGMAEAFGRRYGTPFAVARNGVRRSDWPERAPAEAVAGRPLRLRYAGSIAPDMTRQAVLDVANAAAGLVREGVDMTFEVMTQANWYKAEAEGLSALDGVTVAKADLSPEDYRGWLQEADILLVGYNFDERTKRYVRYSFANKVPEALASGATVLAYGPEEIETLRQLKAHDAAEMVLSPGVEPVAAALRTLVADGHRRLALSRAGRELAFSAFDLDEQKSDLRSALSDSAASTPNALSAQAAAAALGKQPPRQAGLRRATARLLDRFLPSVSARLRQWRAG